MRPTAPPSPDDIDIGSLWHAIVRGRMALAAAVIAAGALTFGFLSMLTPRYTSSAEVLIARDESSYPRRSGEAAFPLESLRVDAGDVANQVEVILSPDLLARVARELKLGGNPEFNAALRRKTLPDELLRMAGFGESELRMSEEERVLDAFGQRLLVYPVANSHVITIDASSADSELASEIANATAKAYIEWTQLSQLRKDSGASALLGGKLEELRREAEAAETALEGFRVKAGLIAGQSNSTLGTQQLSELDTQLSAARASRSEAEARARIVNEMLSAGEIDASAEVLKSPLIQRLLEGRIQIERRLAELSASLLPGHPRMRQLFSELATLKSQIRGEGLKIVRGIGREVTVAIAREQALEQSLASLTGHAERSSQAQARLGALDQEARTKRTLYESHLDRYNEAGALRDGSAVPALARLISTARPSAIPAFPQTVPITLLAMAGTLLLGLGFIVIGQRLRRSRGHAASHAPRTRRAIDVATVPSRAAPARLAASCRSSADVAAHLVRLASELPDLRTLISTADETAEPAAEALDIARHLASKSVPVLLIDLSGVPSGVAGFGDLMADTATFEDAIEADQLSSAHLMGPGSMAIDESRLAAAETVLDALDGTYGHVIVAAGPAVARRLLSAIDGRFDAGVLLASAPASPVLDGRRDFLGLENPPFAVIRLERPSSRTGAPATGIAAGLRRGRDPLRQPARRLG